MGKILEKLMKKYWKNAKKTGKVREIRQSKKVGTMGKVFFKFRTLKLKGSGTKMLFCLPRTDVLLLLPYHYCLELSLCILPSLFIGNICTKVSSHRGGIFRNVLPTRPKVL